MDVSNATLIYRLAISVGCLLAFLLLSPLIDRIVDQERLSRRLFLIIAISRVAFFGVVFLVLKIQPRGDVVGYYYPQALSVMHGLVPYRDFLSSYSLFHPYLDAAVLFIHNSSLSLILLSIVAEMAGLGVWCLLLGKLVRSKESLRRRFNQALLFYLCNVISIFTIALDGTNNSIIALGISLSIFFLWDHKDFASGLAFSMPLLFAKLLPLILLPLFLATARKRWRWLGGCVSPLAVVCMVAASRHMNLLQPLLLEGQHGIESGLPYLLLALSGAPVRPELFQLFGGIILLAAAALYGWKLHSSRNVMDLSIASLGLLSLLFLFAPKAWPVYYEMLLFPLCWLVAGLSLSGRVWALVFFAVVGVQASFWFLVLHNESPQALHGQLAVFQPGAVVYLLLLSGLIGGYIWLALLCARLVSRKTDPLIQ